MAVGGVGAGVRGGVRRRVAVGGLRSLLSGEDAEWGGDGGGWGEGQKDRNRRERAVACSF